MTGTTPSATAPIALVTGASRGIGRATALALAQEGFDIAALALGDADRLAALAGELQRLGRRCLPLDADIGETAAHPDLIEKVRTTLGPIACLVNNAGVSVLQRGDLLEVSAQSYDRCFDINTRGTFFLTQAVARTMLADSRVEGRPRSIVFVTSSNAVAATVERGEYCMSKTALSMAARLFALRLAKHGIGVYEVQPGLILTEMTAPSKPKYDALIANGMTVDPRWGQPEDVARVIRTMAAGLLPYTVAQDVRVDGGLLMQRF
jgi:NAD(P)-dependent dehydrogenase (short-subunit alcohol dehydrogenase family)